MPTIHLGTDVIRPKVLHIHRLSADFRRPFGLCFAAKAEIWIPLAKAIARQALRVSYGLTGIVLQQVCLDCVMIRTLLDAWQLRVLTMVEISVLCLVLPNLLLMLDLPCSA